MSRDADIVDYLLGELSPEDRRRVEVRIGEDDLFRAEVERLRPLVAELSELPGEAWDPGEIPPLPVLPAATAAEPEPAPPERRFAARPWLAVAAAVVVLAVGFGIGLLVRGGDDGPVAGTSIALAPVPGADPAGAGTATMVDDDTGMRLDVHGLAPSGPGQFYELWLLDGPRRVMSLGSFRVPSSGATEVTVPLPVAASDFRYIDVSLEREDGDPGHSGDSVLRAPTSA